MARRLTQADLRRMLSYDPDSGEFRWLVGRSRTAAGSVAGSIGASGHRSIKIAGRSHYAHRLAWLYMTGEWPAEQVDHINGTPDDNRWDNLREASNAENCRNTRRRQNNTSGTKGVTWDARRGKWNANICVNRRYIFLGYFEDIEAAAAAYAAASQKYHGAFGRVA